MSSPLTADPVSTVEGAACPVCEGPVSPPAGTRPNEIIDCAECASELEVVSVQPVLLAVAPAVEEDWGE